MQYKVLARKYRPQTFSELIGQDAMVRIFRNAFELDRIAHAFVLTGVRGVGKTTSARIIAKGLNCTGTDGKGGPTVEPCGDCSQCCAIADGRHVDVLEMDAASNTGVADIREVIENVSYASARARYKIYIIDEVHMLSYAAFNALLKTLEEPPPHVKFIFATTDIAKVPITVLSRCQRFDLRRVEPERLQDHLAMIAEQESAGISPGALRLIVRASEGSVRDGISILDKAISTGEAEISEDRVREMLGLADSLRTLDLLEMILRGRVSDAIRELDGQYYDGVDPVAVLRELAELVHWLSMVKFAPEVGEEMPVGPQLRERGERLAKDLPARVSARMWQMLLAALEEVANAPNARMATQMAIIRMTHVADLPTPGEIVSKLSQPSDDRRQGAIRGSASEPGDRQPRHFPGTGSLARSDAETGSGGPGHRDRQNGQGENRQLKERAAVSDPGLPVRGKEPVGPGGSTPSDEQERDVRPGPSEKTASQPGEQNAQGVAPATVRIPEAVMSHPIIRKTFDVFPEATLTKRSEEILREIFVSETEKGSREK